MRTHRFDIIATGLDHNSADYERKFHDAGCGDATLAYRNGQFCVSFARNAASLDEAIVGATDAIRSTGARIIRVDRDADPDLVS
jgi:hypothetical protein